ncbi:TPA: glycosyltransferase family 25 protein [Neisseria meningitidis]|jgi:Glycosyltransferase involved in LPS biosynthesis|uniref:Lacto-N-neotetraose biosynthesis glycosyltransferase LgtE n=8 Tax=Neisseria meningitidis TaxID=487 RepID=LGTE_NEIMB|nr:glycosyltransferase family 25 protein [Neisseria meningitidis]Q51117.2 RecName: Full=Lacto-N-neotetraose biosynthesis glycosyltransferase LgtE [Neisseria meningitidis MC58]AJC63077.1 lacto-N-neotetraose biosynthesis glycosyltransferase lgtB [Neisseria meningitidis LNP21362]AAF42255.1 lacto-N-neotetraose biosynthesis glycosyl transferase LgtE [Neisseria meningitidis MC58]ADY96433.1 lacto-N-neotetraose biosynthesis glycosyl transferase LgtE [Neisseria meningitidis H44/76]ARC07006.1 lacto-N-ne
MQNHVISLASAAERRAHIAATFGVRGIPFQFFDALMPSEELNRMMAELVPGLAKQHLLSEVEKACFMSHAVLWKQALDEGLPYVAVFEDDVLLGKDAEKFLAEDTWLEERFDKDSAFIVRLETMFAKVIVRPDKVLNYENRSFPLLESEHWGTAGYIISREAMRFFLERFAVLPAEWIKAVDWMMFTYFFDKEGMPVYQVNPALCTQELHYAKFLSKNSMLGSDLEKDREQERRHRRSLKVMFDLKRALGKFGREKKKRMERQRQAELEKAYGRRVISFK